MNKKQNSDKSEKVLRIGSVSSRYIRKEAKKQIYKCKESCNKGKMNFRTLFTPCATLPATGRIRIKSLKPVILS